MKIKWIIILLLVINTAKSQDRNTEAFNKEILKVAGKAIMCGVEIKEPFQILMDTLRYTKKYYTLITCITISDYLDMHEVIPVMDILRERMSDPVKDKRGRERIQTAILRYVLRIKDTTFRKEIRKEIDSISEAEMNIYEKQDLIDKYNKYLIDVHKDDYGVLVLIKIHKQTEDYWAYSHIFDYYLKNRTEK